MADKCLRGAFAVMATVLCVTSAHAEGALAIGSCGAYGYGFDFPSEAAAREAARRNCDGRCRVVAAFSRQCAAFVISGDNACGGYGWAVRPTLGRAQNAASRECYRNGGSNCVVRAWACDRQR